MRFPRLLVPAALLAGLLSPSINAAPCAGFTDVDTASAFCVNVEWIKNRGITLGCTATLYCPNNPVTRLQMAAFLNRLGNVTFQQGGNAFGAGAVLGTTDNQRLSLRVNGVHAMHFEPRSPPETANVVGGAAVNAVFVGASGAVIGGGGASGSSALGSSCVNAFNCANTVTDHYGTIGGGIGNVAGNNDGNFANAGVATVAGGFANIAGPTASVGGGAFNQAIGSISVAAGGASNVASGTYSAVGGGVLNRAGATYATVPGGNGNKADGSASFAAGTNAVAATSGQFVWADQAGPIFDPATNPNGWANATNTFNARATGGVWFVVGIDANGTAQAGCAMQPGTPAWNCASSRDTKTDFERVDVLDVLERVVALPMDKWRFKGEPQTVRHMGPMAQDFRAAFGLGHDDKTITSVDIDGVALAAIQGLNAKLEERIAAKDAELAEHRAVIRALTERLNAFEARLQ